MDYHRAELTAEILKALGHPIRLILVDTLAKKEMTVSELNELVQVDKSTLSRHLAQLRRAGLLIERREGTRSYHRLANPCVRRLRECADEVLRCRLDRDRKLLAEMKKS